MLGLIPEAGLVVPAVARPSPRSLNSCSCCSWTMLKKLDKHILHNLKLVKEAGMGDLAAAGPMPHCEQSSISVGRIR
jgi:hypothetical protein